MPRILRNLKIREVSAVDKGAGRGVRVMLIKRLDDDDTENTTMPNVDINKATPMFNEYVGLIMKRDGVSRSRAYDIALTDETGRALFDLSMTADRLRSEAANEAISSPGMFSKAQDA